MKNIITKIQNLFLSRTAQQKRDIQKQAKALFSIFKHHEYFQPFYIGNIETEITLGWKGYTQPAQMWVYRINIVAHDHYEKTANWYYCIEIEKIKNKYKISFAVDSTIVGDKTLDRFLQIFDRNGYTLETFLNAIVIKFI